VAKLKTKLEYPDEEHISAANQNRREDRKRPTRIHLPDQPRRDPASTLSEVEAQVLLSLLAGQQNIQIAASLGTDQTEVKEHIKSILRKTRTRSRASGHLQT
jgi:DNA-binding NarL/FixJ family response regulator